MSHPNGFDFKNALETPMALKFHFLYDMTHSKTLKLCNCAVGDAEFVLMAPWGPFTKKRESRSLRLSTYASVVVCPSPKGLCLMVYTNLPSIQNSSLGTSFFNTLTNAPCPPEHLFLLALWRPVTVISSPFGIPFRIPVVSCSIIFLARALLYLAFR